MTSSRDPKWQEYARKFIYDHPACLICGRTAGKRNVHHYIPVAFARAIGRPDLEMDPRNAKYVLCEGGACNAHCVVGHLGWYSSYDPYLEAALVQLKGKTEKEIRQMQGYQRAVSIRPKPAEYLSLDEIKQLRVQIDAEMPCLKVSGSYPPSKLSNIDLA